MIIWALDLMALKTIRATPSKRWDGTVKYSAIDVTEENVRMYGNTGIYNGRGNVKMSINGKPLTADVRVTIVWVKQNGQWKRVSFQATQVQPASTGS